MPHLQNTNYTTAPWLGQGVINVGNLFGTSTSLWQFYENYLAWYLKMDVSGGAKPLKYTSFIMNMTWNVDLHGLEICWGWKKVILQQRKSFVLEEEEKQIEAEHSWSDEMSHRRMLHRCRIWRINPLTWKMWWTPNNASRWQMGFNTAFKGLMCSQDRSGGSSSMRSCIFTIQAKQ